MTGRRPLKRKQQMTIKDNIYYVMKYLVNMVPVTPRKYIVFKAHGKRGEYYRLGIREDGFLQSGQVLRRGLFL